MNFAAFYEAIHGFAPFPWQRRLAQQVLDSGWPAVLALPTAAGKTSAIDIGLFALASQAATPIAARTAPLRIFFVIDRRLVVDQAAEHAQKLRRALANPKNAVVKQVADALLRFGGTAPVQVAALRGGIYRDDSWARTPNQPTVCVSTVDQVGSRLLFRGYGVSEFARPIHAALTGNDALYLVDEAHLSEPFLQTLQSVCRYRHAPWAKESVGGPLRMVEISATPQSTETPFKISAEDQEHPELKRRLNASKPAKLLEPAKLEQEAVALAVQARVSDIKIVGIVVNRVASAREIFSRLPGTDFDDKVLLTGRIRPWDRDALLSRCLERIRAGRLRQADDKPLFVVATMTVEVGADLDFDYLITEAAPLASLRQRFGRLDRLGRFGRASGAILLRKARDGDPIYGDDLARTWEWLRSQPGETIDFGVNTLDEVIRNAKTPPPPTEPRHGPVLFPAHLDNLVQTSPTPDPTPDVAPFLHGAEALNAADVQLVWRADLKIGNEGDWRDTVAAAPPRSRETLSLPVYAARKWLSQQRRVEVADIEGVIPTDLQDEETRDGRVVLRWRGPDSDESRIIGPTELRPGDTLIVPSDYGGADAFGWNPDSAQPVSDVGDLCVNEMANLTPQDGQRRLIRLRLHGDSRALALRALVDSGEEYEVALEDTVAALIGASPENSLLMATLQEFRKSTVQVRPYPAGVVLTARVRSHFFRSDSQLGDSDDADADDSDDSSSLRGGISRPVAVTLEEHTQGVIRWVRSFITGIGLDSEITGAILKAAYLHDIGKADVRFQSLLYGDEPDDIVLAKSGKDFDAKQREVLRKRFNLPVGFRHELTSVSLVRNHREQLLQEVPEQLRPVVEFLIGTHHGRGRPFMPVIFESGAEPVILTWGGREISANPNHRLAHLDSGWPEIFWDLVRRFGYWGLAYLEMLLRLADWARSAEEQHAQEKTS